jgi:DNA-binding XRE family transcriptional regulator
MSGHKNFRILREQLDKRLAQDPAGRARLESERRLTEAIIQLTELREARGATQQQIADAWEVTQANISQIEHTPDISLSTLRNYVEALGGRLEIRAVFPDQTINLLSGPDNRVAALPGDEPEASGAARTG